MYSFSASQRVFNLLALASLNLSHAAAFCFCCKGVRSSSKPTLQPASFPLALKTFFLSATLPNSTMTRPGLASPSLLFEKRVALVTTASVCKRVLPTKWLTALVRLSRQKRQSVYGPNTESFGYRKRPKGFRFDRDQRAPVPIGRMRQGFL